MDDATKAKLLHWAECARTASTPELAREYVSLAYQLGRIHGEGAGYREGADSVLAKLASMPA